MPPNGMITSLNRIKIGVFLSVFFVALLIGIVNQCRGHKTAESVKVRDKETRR